MRRLVAAFLDRDGTINEKAPEDDYITSPDRVSLLEGAAEAIGRINSAGVPVFVVTNQRGIARGHMTAGDLAAVHGRLDELLAEADAWVDRYLVCPHEAGTCRCRKPGTLLLERAASELSLDTLADTVLIGDSASDVIAGRRMGALTIRLAASPPALDDPEAVADRVSGSLLEAVDSVAPALR